MDPISAGIGAAGSLVGGLVSSINNRWMMRQQQKYNTSERIASQDWQDQQRRAQNQYAEDMYNQYSSPVALARQYIQAGFNPGMMMQNGSAGSVQASSGSSGGAPSGAMLTPPYMQTPDPTQGFVNMANVLKSLAEAKQIGVNTEFYEKTLGARVAREEAASKAEQIATRLKMKYEDKERFIALLSAAGDVDLKGQQLQNTKKEFEILCEKYNVAKFESDHMWDKFHWYEQEAITRVGLGRAQVENTEADTALKQAQENLTWLQSVTEKEKPDMYRAVARLDRLIGDGHEIANNIRSATSDEEKASLITEYKLTERRIESQIDYLEKQARYYARKGDWIHVDEVFDKIDRIHQHVDNMRSEALRFVR